MLDGNSHRKRVRVDNRVGCNKYSVCCDDDGGDGGDDGYDDGDDDNGHDDGGDDGDDGGGGLVRLQPSWEQLKQRSITLQIIILLTCSF